MKDNDWNNLYSESLLFLSQFLSFLINLCVSSFPSLTCYTFDGMNRMVSVTSLLKLWTISSVFLEPVTGKYFKESKHDSSRDDERDGKTCESNEWIMLIKKTRVGRMMMRETEEHIQQIMKRKLDVSSLRSWSQVWSDLLFLSLSSSFYSLWQDFLKVLWMKF